MGINIIPLANRKIKLRRISRGMLNETINIPDQIVEGYGGRIINQKIYFMENKKKLLRVVYEKKGEEITIVTTYLTNQIKRYWRD